jgi:hypothetical protein
MQRNLKNRKVQKSYARKKKNEKSNNPSVAAAAHLGSHLVNRDVLELVHLWRSAANKASNSSAVHQRWLRSS